MVTLWFEQHSKVVLARFSATFSIDDIVTVDASAAPILRRFGPVRCLFDFSGVVKIAITAAQVAARGKVSTLAPDQERVIVVPSRVGYGLARLFAAYQAVTGNREPVIVHTLEEAYVSLEISNPAFEPAGEVV